MDGGDGNYAAGVSDQEVSDDSGPGTSGDEEDFVDALNMSSGGLQGASALNGSDNNDNNGPVVPVVNSYDSEDKQDQPDAANKLSSIALPFYCNCQIRTELTPFSVSPLQTG